jgi:hypothetical protein
MSTHTDEQSYPSLMHVASALQRACTAFARHCCSTPLYRRHRQGQVLPCRLSEALSSPQPCAHTLHEQRALAKTRTQHPCQRPARAKASAEAPARRALGRQADTVAVKRPPKTADGRRRRNVARAGTIDRRETGWIPCVCSARKRRRRACGSARRTSSRPGNRVRGLGRERRGHRTRGGRRLVCPGLAASRARRGGRPPPRRGVHGGATAVRAPPCRAWCVRACFFSRDRHGTRAQLWKMRLVDRWPHRIVLVLHAC